MNDFKKFGGFRDKRGGGRFDRPGEGRGGFGGGRPSFGGGRPSFGGGKPFGGRQSFGGRGGGRDFRGGRDEEREMFTATCADCGKPCQVPFRPTGEKPVFCNDCFASKKGAEMGGSERRFERRDDRREERAPRPEARDTRIDDLATQVRELHAKLDALIMVMDVKQEESKRNPVTIEAMPKNAKTKKVEAAIAERKAKKVTKKK